MDTVTAPRIEAFRDVRIAAPPEAERTVTVVATYELSHAGRKASLLAGGNGHAVQRVTMQVPASRFHLVRVDGRGAASLKLRPLYQLGSDQRVVRVDRYPKYDAPPTDDELLREAARNHQLERAFFAERTSDRVKERENGRGLREDVAAQFLADPTQRALRFPPQTPTMCVLQATLGRVQFDLAADDGPLARQVPPEAWRRLRADLRGRVERRREVHAQEMATRVEKERCVASWITEHGTPDQQARHAAGVFPMAEAVDAITDQVLQPLNRLPAYEPRCAEHLQAHLRTFRKYANAVVGRGEFSIEVKDAHAASQCQWALLQELKLAFPEATLELREHRLTWLREPSAPALILFGIRLKLKFGPFTLCREYAAPEA